MKQERKEKQIYKLGNGKYPIYAELTDYDVTYCQPQGSIDFFIFEELITGRKMYGGGWTSRTLYYHEYVEKYLSMEPEELMRILKEQNPAYNAPHFSYSDSGIHESSLAEAGAFFKSLGEEGIKDYIKMLDEMQEDRDKAEIERWGKWAIRYEASKRKEKEQADAEDYAKQLIKKRNLK